MRVATLRKSRPLKYFIERRPTFSSVLGVYAIIVLLVYTWTLLVSFYKFPSWIQYLTINQILTIYAYSFSTNLLESLFILTAILLLDHTLFLALKNKEEFLARSSLLVIFVLASAMWRLLLFQDYQEASVFVSGEKQWWAVTTLLAIPSAVFAPKVARVRALLESLAERAGVFLYVYLPLSLVSLAAVIIRNLQ